MGSIHTISSKEKEDDRENDWYTYFMEAKESKSYNDTLLNYMNIVVLCHRCQD